MMLTFPSIQSWLAAEPAADDAFEDNDEVGQAPLLAQGDYDLHLVDFFDFFTVELCAEGEGFRISATPQTTDLELGLELLLPGGLPVAISTQVGEAEVIDVNLPPGSYLVKLIKDRGWGGPYTLSVTIPNTYGDVDGNGSAGLSDVFCILDALQGNSTQCSFQEADLHPCGGDSTLNLFDVYAVLRAIGGEQDCGTCP